MKKKLSMMLLTTLALNTATVALANETNPVDGSSEPTEEIKAENTMQINFKIRGHEEILATEVGADIKAILDAFSLKYPGYKVDEATVTMQGEGPNEETGLVVYEAMVDLITDDKNQDSKTDTDKETGQRSAPEKEDKTAETPKTQQTTEKIELDKADTVADLRGVKTQQDGQTHLYKVTFVDADTQAELTTFYMESKNTHDYSMNQAREIFKQAYPNYRLNDRVQDPAQVEKGAEETVTLGGKTVTAPVVRVVFSMTKDAKIEPSGKTIDTSKIHTAPEVNALERYFVVTLIDEQSKKEIGQVKLFTDYKSQEKDIKEAIQKAYPDYVLKGNLFDQKTDYDTLQTIKTEEGKEVQAIQSTAKQYILKADAKKESTKPAESEKESSSVKGGSESGKEDSNSTTNVKKESSTEAASQASEAKKGLLPKTSEAGFMTPVVIVAVIALVVAGIYMIRKAK